MKVKNKKNNLRRFFSILTVVFILSLTLAVPCFAYNGTIINLNGSATITGFVSNGSGVVSAILFSTSESAYYSLDTTILSQYSDINDYLADYHYYNGSASSTDTRYITRVEAYFNGITSSYNNGLTVGVTAGKNQVMDEIIQNANSNGTNIPNQSYTSQNLINVLNEIRNSSEYDGAFNQEDSDIRYLVRELIRLGVLAESYDTFELTVDGNLENAKRIWYLEGLEESEEGINERLQQAYNTGYTDGGKDADFMNDTLITIFSSPYYILNEVFNFEIFGVSVAGIITFLLSIILVGWIIRILL